MLSIVSSVEAIGCAASPSRPGSVGRCGSLEVSSRCLRSAAADDAAVTISRFRSKGLTLRAADLPFNPMTTTIAATPVEFWQSGRGFAPRAVTAGGAAAGGRGGGGGGGGGGWGFLPPA